MECKRGLAHGVAPWDRFLDSMPVQPALADLLPLLAAEKKAAAMFAQLCLWVALRWEEALTTAVGGEPSGLKVQKERKGLPTPYRMQLQLARHLNATQVYCSDAHPILLASMATDKSSVGGLPLHNTFVQINGRSGVMFTLPQVVLGRSETGGSGDVNRAFLVTT